MISVGGLFFYRLNNTNTDLDRQLHIQGCYWNLGVFRAQVGVWVFSLASVLWEKNGFYCLFLLLNIDKDLGYCVSLEIQLLLQFWSEKQLTDCFFFLIWKHRLALIFISGSSNLVTKSLQEDTDMLEDKKFSCPVWLVDSNKHIVG